MRSTKQEAERLSDRTSTVVRLTKTVIDGATHLMRTDPATGALVPRQRLLFDSEMRGFGVLVGVSKKTFVVQRDVRGKAVRHTIGAYGPFTVEQARKEARQLLARMARGENVNDTKRRERQRGITLESAWELYQGHLVTKSRSAKTIEGYEYIMSKYLKTWLPKALADISREDVHRKHKGLGKSSGPYTANGVFRVFRAVYNRARRQHTELPENPCDNIDWFPEHRRPTKLAQSSLADWYQEVSALPEPVRRDYLLLVLFSGLRRTSASEIRWEHVDFERRLLHIPNPKGGRAFDLPLSDFLVDLLRERQRSDAALESDWVFPASSESGHIEEPKEGPKRIGTAFRIHDLRNHFITVAESLDISQYAIKLLVNHTLPRDDVTAGYVQVDVERLRAPMQEITDRLRLLCRVGKPTKPNVVSIRRTR